MYRRGHISVLHETKMWTCSAFGITANLRKTSDQIGNPKKKLIHTKNDSYQYCLQFTFVAKRYTPGYLNLERYEIDATFWPLYNLIASLNHSSQWLQFVADSRTTGGHPTEAARLKMLSRCQCAFLEATFGDGTVWRARATASYGVYNVARLRVRLTLGARVRLAFHLVLATDSAPSRLRRAPSPLPSTFLLHTNKSGTCV